MRRETCVGKVTNCGNTVNRFILVALRGKPEMTLKSYAIAMVLSAFLWATAYYAAVAGYRMAQHAGLIPGDMLKVALASLIG